METQHCSEPAALLGAGEDPLYDLHVGDCIGERRRRWSVFQNRPAEKVGLLGVLVADRELDFFDYVIGFVVRLYP